MMPVTTMLRRAAPFLWAAAGLAVLHLAWVGAVRYHEDARAERSAQARRPRPAPPPAEDAGGPGVRIIQFYAGAGEVTRGDRVIFCYGVRNALSVRIEPRVEELKPALNRCFWVEPRRTTTYRLVAEGDGGAVTSEAFTVKVNPPPPRILFVELSHAEVRRGQPITICYGLENAVAARLDPVFPAIAVSPRFCLRTIPVRTTNYALVAQGADGRTDREPFTITVLQ